MAYKDCYAWSETLGCRLEDGVNKCLCKMLNKKAQMTETRLCEMIGKRIRFHRRAKDITQRELANKLGLESASFICDVEKGRKFLPVYKLFEAEKILGPLWPTDQTIFLSKQKPLRPETTAAPRSVKNE